MIKTRGFTLIELLVVMVIISVISAIAVITLSYNQHRLIESEVKQIKQLLLVAEQEALLRPMIVGVSVMPTHLTWYRLNNDGKWEPLTTRPFVPHRFLKQMIVTLIMQDKIISLRKDPIIMVSMNGELTPFTLVFSNKNKTPVIKLVGDVSGDITSEWINEA